MTFRFRTPLALLVAACVDGRLTGPVAPVPAPVSATKPGWGTIAAQIPLKSKPSLAAAKPAAVAKPAAASAEKPGWGKIAAQIPKKTKSQKASLTAKSAAAKKAEAQPSEEEELARLQQGLATVQKLRSTFAAKEGKVGSMEQLASGAMATELGKSNSTIWSTIQSMLNASMSVSAQLKGKSESEKEKIWGSFEGVLNRSAESMAAVADQAGKADQKHGNEYLLGLLNQHPKWSMAQQLNATRRFGDETPLAQELLAHHNASEPLAPQLAKLMDAAAAPAKKASAALLQLVSSLRRE